MAKPLGPKSILIREAITANPGKGNTEIATMLMDAEERMDDKLKITAQDVATQRQAMKKPGAQKAPTSAAPTVATKPAGDGRRKPGRKPGRKPAAVAPRAASAPTGASPVDLIDRTLALAQDCGGVEQLKRLVERLAGMQGR